jgi:hypothetical protein
MYFLGLDLGQKRDYSAVAVVERIDHRQAFQRTAFQKLLVRHVERLPLGTAYPRVVDRVRAIVRSGELAGNCALAVDATGVGAPVVDMLRAARLGCDLSAVTITGGDRVSGASVPKRDLMAEVLMLLEQGQLKIGNLREGPQLVRELMDVRQSRGRVGADGTGEHDDLTIALALACWRAKGRGFCGEVGHRLPGI